MQKLLRKNLLKPCLTSVRGGHGWDAPHPPVPTSYEHKRIISIFDSGMWWGCGTAPEYLISYFEMHLKDQYGAGAEILRHAANAGAVIFGLGVFMTLCYTTVEYGLTEETVNGFYQRVLKEQKERPMSKRNIWGFSTSHEDGKIYVTYDNPRRNFLWWKKAIAPEDDKNQVNTEARNAIIKLEAEIRKKYQ